MCMCVLLRICVRYSFWVIDFKVFKICFSLYILMFCFIQFFLLNFKFYFFTPIKFWSENILLVNVGSRVVVSIFFFALKISFGCVSQKDIQISTLNCLIRIDFNISCCKLSQSQNYVELQAIRYKWIGLQETGNYHRKTNYIHSISILFGTRTPDRYNYI